jgi:predicted Zn-ribbon and HTH transcriptional regulator
VKLQELLDERDTDPRKSQPRDSYLSEEAFTFVRPPRCPECGFPEHTLVEPVVYHTHASTCPRRSK